MRINLTGKVAIVTGTGRGIGKAIAKALAAANASVVINDVDSNAATQASQEIESSGGTLSRRKLTCVLEPKSTNCLLGAALISASIRN